MRYHPLALLGATLCAACGGDNLVLPTLTPPGAAKLGVAAGAPSQASVGTALTPQLRVQVQDAGGGAVHDAGLAVTAALDGAGGAKLRGQLTQPTDTAGVATFGDLAINGPPGSYTIRFSSAGLTPATTPPIVVTQQRVATTASIRSLNPSQGTALTPVTVSFSIVAATGSDTPAGSVTVSDGSESCSAAVSVGSCAVTPKTGGDKTITVTYPGEGPFDASRATASYRVDRVATNAETPEVQPRRSVSRNSPVTFRTRVSATRGSVQGTVVFARDACGADGAPLGDPVPLQPDGTATFTTAFYSVGTVSVVACYGGDATFAPAESPPASVLVLPW
jgi:hypothetical protein